MDKSILGIRPGSVIQHTYEVTALLGEGGMGATFSGVNMATNHEVAIKVITAEFARNKKAADLFRREANLMRTIQSDAVVGYETTMMDESGQLYLVMEYIKGKPLSHFLEKGARLAEIDVLKLGRRLSEGLTAIHKFGIVHRDISPDNVMIPDDDILGAKLIDFGVASDTVGTEKSIIGDSFAGKISYAAPEQLGIGTGKVSPATDLYSLGLVLIRVAGLQVPGAGHGMAAAIDARRVDQDISDGRIGTPLAQVLRQLLKVDPAERPTNPVAEFDAALAALAKTALPPPKTDTDAFNDDPVHEDTGSAGTKSGVIAAAVLLLAALGGVGWFFMTQNAAPTGVAMDNAEGARAALASEDPLAEINALIDRGGEDNLNVAFGALLAMSRNEEESDRMRAEASFAVAQMYDPATYDRARSPFPAANANSARRFYQQALELGHNGAQTALDRIGD